MSLVGREQPTASSRISRCLCHLHQAKSGQKRPFDMSLRIADNPHASADGSKPHHDPPMSSFVVDAMVQTNVCP